MPARLPTGHLNTHLLLRPQVQFLQGRHHTWYAGAYTLFNTHEIATMSGAHGGAQAPGSHADMLLNGCAPPHCCRAYTSPWHHPAPYPTQTVAAALLTLAGLPAVVAAAASSYQAWLWQSGWVLPTPLHMTSWRRSRCVGRLLAAMRPRLLPGADLPLLRMAIGACMQA